MYLPKFTSLKSLLILQVEVELMEEAGVDGAEEHGHAGKESHAAVDGVDGGKDFGATRLGLIHGPHAGEDHAGIEEAIGKAQVHKIGIACHADGQRERDKRHGH